MPSESDQYASRRKFLQFLAASPLLAASDLAALAAEAPSRLPDPMMWAPRNLDKLISTPKEAINVFDFEPVMQKNVPPAHFGYMASGIDDEVTLRANREGFLKFQLRPRRLVDVSKVDMSVDLLGMKFDSPDHHRADRRPQGLSRRRRSGRRTRGQGRRPSANPLDPGDDLDQGHDRGARQADLVPALCHQQVRGRQAPRRRARNDRARPWSRSRSTAAAAATRKPCSG